MSSWVVLKDAPKWQSFRIQSQHASGSAPKRSKSDLVKDSPCPPELEQSEDGVSEVARQRPPGVRKAKMKRQKLAFDTSEKTKAAAEMASALKNKAQIAAKKFQLQLFSADTSVCFDLSVIGIRVLIC